MGGKGEEGSPWVDESQVKEEKKEKRYSSFAIHTVYNRCELGP